MKQRLAGKILKHQRRYSAQQVQNAMDRCVCSLRRYYMRLYREGHGPNNYYVHMACRPYPMLCEDVEELWNVKPEDLPVGYVDNEKIIFLMVL